MTQYRRIRSPGATWFFTVNLVERHNNNLLVKNIGTLRSAFHSVKQRQPFHIDAVVILPDHLHCIWTLPEDDSDYSTRWGLIKAHFSRSVVGDERRSASRIKRGERGIWQRRFWEHRIRDETDFERHVDYIHWNPVKHGYVGKVADWPHSSFHDYVSRGTYPLDWGSGETVTIAGAE